MIKLPQGWEWKSLGEICEVVMGQSPSGNCIFNKDKNKDLIEFHQGKIAFSDKYINKSDFVTSDVRKIAKKNSVVLSVRAPVGEVNIASEDIAIGRGLCSLNGIKINNEFLFFYLLTLKKYFNDNSTGSTFKAISTKAIKETKIPLPSLQEQERMVGILDESFAKIDESIKILEQDLLNLDELMQSALQKAFNPLKDNTKENYKLPQGWEWKSLGEICEINPRNKIDDEINVSFVSMNKILDGYSNEFSYAIKKWKDVKNGFTHFKQGDIGLAKITPCFENKKSVIFDDLENGVGAGTTELHVIRAVDNVISKFLLWFFKTEKFIQNGILNMTGATGHKRIPKDFIKNLQIPLPPLQEQEQIASHLDELSSHVKNLKQNYQAQIKNLQELKKSLLDKAFQGRL
ncbi:TPA: restriction endonuclease subunit S [Campylobacter lari]|nr:restriction endonuclease subunit S [Campylobacter lari]